MLERTSQTAAIIFGGVIFLFFSIAACLGIFRPQKQQVFFQLTLCMLMAYGIIAAWGRYETTDNQFDRYAAIYPWLIWSGCIMTHAHLKKTGIALSLTICFASLVTAPQYINRQLMIQRDSTQADINMVNGSFIHMSYQKTPMPLKLFGFKPDFFHAFQKERSWGIYHRYAIPESLSTGDDICEAVKTKEFVVSEKQFVEYQLNGWNVSSDSYLPSVYALDENNQVVAQGISMPRETSWLPLALLSREKLMIYMVIPRSHPLGDLRLVGGSKDNWCEVTLLKKQ
jgi:hypothetical protein